jgi:ACS family hexuronate transporter-like MFS transporter
MLFVAAALNYLDRQTLSLLAPDVQRDLGIDDDGYALAVNAFLAAYVVAHLIGGRLVDRLGGRLALALFVGWWSMAGLLTAGARSLAGLAGMRALLGLGEAGMWVAAPKLVGEWFAPRERGLAVGIYSMGATIGATIAPPVMVVLAAHGWPCAFVVTGVAGLVWLLPWWRVSRRAPAPGAPEPGAPASVRAAPAPWRPILQRADVWLFMAARLVTDPVWYFFLFWFAKYLVAERGIAPSGVGITWLVFLGADLGCLAGGWLAGILIGRGTAPARAHLRIMAACAALVPAAALVPLLAGTTPVLVVAMVAVAAHLAWLTNLTALAVDRFPATATGTIIGLISAGSAAGGMAMNQALAATIPGHGYGPAFAAMLVVHPLAWLALRQVVGRQGGRDRPATAIESSA